MACKGLRRLDEAGGRFWRRAAVAVDVAAQLAAKRAELRSKEDARAALASRIRVEPPHLHGTVLAVDWLELHAAVSRLVQHVAVGEIMKPASRGPQRVVPPKCACEVS
mgnify:CR=1 FL=1